MTRSHLFILSFLALAAFKVNAQADRDSFRQAMDACFTETGITKPERGVRPSDEDRQKIDDCLSAKGITRPERPQGGSYAGGENNQDVVREAMKACATENNLSQPSPGNPPSDEDRQKMESCLAGKGLSMPQRPEGGRGGGPRGTGGSRVSAQ